MRRIAFILLAVCAALVSCTKVRVDNGSNQVSFVCSVDWGKMQGITQHPDTFSVATARTVRSRHAVWDSVAVVTSGQTPDTLTMPAGEYHSILYGCDTPGDYTFGGTKAFAKDSTVSMRVIVAQMRRLKKAEVQEVTSVYNHLLVNYFDTLPAAPVLYRASLRQELPITSAVEVLRFTPEPMVQTVTFRIHIEAEEEVAPNAVMACVTGVPGNVELMSGFLLTDESSLGQTLFEMENLGSGTWQGTVKVLGVKASQDPELKVGPGILRVSVDSGIKHRKVERVLNLKSYLDENPLITFTDVEGLYRGGARTVTYDISQVLKLKGGDTEHGGEDPVNDWAEPEDGNVKDIIDGDDEDHD